MTRSVHCAGVRRIFTPLARLAALACVSLLASVSQGCSGSASDDAPTAGMAGAPQTAGSMNTGATPSTGGMSAGGTSAGATSAGASNRAGEGGAPRGGSGSAGSVSTSGGSSDSGPTAGTGGGDSAGGNAGSSGTGGTSSSSGGGRASGGAGALGGVGTVGGAGSGGGSSGAAGELGALTLFIAGDSTVQTYADTGSKTDQAGWGQMLGASFDSRVTVENRAIGGRTARRFIDEGRLDDILEDLRAGDYLLVQFGTNDGNRTATYELGGKTIPYYLEPATDFKTYLKKYIDGTVAKGATPVLVTPPPRNSAYCTGGNGTSAHAQAMRELGAAERTFVVDLNQKTVDYLKPICPAPTPENFFLLRADGTVDGTHFQENGARIMAGFVADELRHSTLSLARYLR